MTTYALASIKTKTSTRYVIGTEVSINRYLNTLRDNRTQFKLDVIDSSESFTDIIRKSNLKYNPLVL